MTASKSTISFPKLLKSRTRKHVGLYQSNYAALHDIYNPQKPATVINMRKLWDYCKSGSIPMSIAVASPRKTNPWKFQLACLLIRTSLMLSVSERSKSKWWTYNCSIHDIVRTTDIEMNIFYFYQLTEEENNIYIYSRTLRNMTIFILCKIRILYFISINTFIILYYISLNIYYD